MGYFYMLPLTFIEITARVKIYENLQEPPLLLARMFLSA